MNYLSLSPFVSLSALLLATSFVACSSTLPISESAGGPSQGGPETPFDDAERAIAEADIVQMSDGRLYAMSLSGSVAVVDLSTPGQLTLLGKTMLAGRPFEMYRRGSQLVTMSNNAVDRYGEPLLPAASEEAAYAIGYNSDYYDDGSDRGSAVIVLDVADPTQLRTVATFGVPGEIADSRVVGDVLYLVTYESSYCYRCATTPRTLVTSFDISDATNPREIDRLEFLAPPDLWDEFWKRSVVATPERLYVGGAAEDYVPTWGRTGPLQNVNEGVIDVVDITDASGRLRKSAQVRVPGIITSRWQIDERDGVLRVVSQRGVVETTNGTGMPSVDTFQIDADGAFTPLGHTDLQLPIQEGLKTVRFDRDRAYAITFENSDPLFTIDLRDPAAPQQRGELVMPGYVFHLEPRGDRLLGLGLDTDDEGGHLNVSLFDVSDLDRPIMLSRVPFGATGSTDEFAVTDFELPEDQNRIQKAFRLLDDGTIVVPFSAPTKRYGSADSCDTMAGGVQLVEWRDDTLTKRATLPMRGNPRRALENGSELVAVSDSNVRSFSLVDRDSAVETADVVIGACARRYNYFRSIYADRDYACATGRAPGGRGGLGAFGLLGLVGLAAASRHRSTRRRPALTANNGNVTL